MSDWLIWCDGNETTGLGHVARCLGYAEALSSSGCSVEMTGDYSSAARTLVAQTKIKSSPHSPIVSGNWKAPEPLKSCRGLLLDSYQIAASDLEAIKQMMGQRPICIIDDFSALDRYPCDAIISFTITAHHRIWKNSASAQTFLGTPYFPARQWMRDERLRRQSMKDGAETRQPLNILIAPGGSDREAVAYRLVRALYEIAPDASLTVCLPENSAKREAALETLAKFRAPQIYQFLPNLSVQFRDCDLCLCGGGLTKYEGAFSGIPVASLAQTRGQQDDTDAMTAEGITFDLGFAPETHDADLERRLRQFLTDDKARFRQIENGLEKIGSDNPSITAHPFHSLLPT